MGMFGLVTGAYNMVEGMESKSRGGKIKKDVDRLNADQLERLLAADARNTRLLQEENDSIRERREISDDMFSGMADIARNFDIEAGVTEMSSEVDTAIGGGARTLRTAVGGGLKNLKKVSLALAGQRTKSQLATQIRSNNLLRRDNMLAALSQPGKGVQLTGSLLSEGGINRSVRVNEARATSYIENGRDMQASAMDDFGSFFGSIGGKNA